jgi:hypothetical protein
VLYPGSPFPLDPGESGKHGVWFLDIEPDRAPAFTFRPIARHRYQPLTVDLTGIEHANEAGQRITDAVRDLHDTALGEPDGASLEYLLVRVHLGGAIPVGLNLVPELERIQLDYRLTRGSIETIRDRTTPRVDLHAIATEQSPPGAVARILLALQDDKPTTPLLAAARQHADAMMRQSPFGDVRDDAGIDPQAALERASWQLLNTLLAQQDRHA